MKDRKLLQEICAEDGCTKDSCFLKYLMLHNPLSDRQAMQVKLIDKFKYEFSEEAGYDIGYDKAMDKWIEMGYAKKYADNWDNDISTHHLTAMYYNLKRNK